MEKCVSTGPFSKEKQSPYCYTQTIEQLHEVPHHSMPLPSVARFFFFICR